MSLNDKRSELFKVTKKLFRLLNERSLLVADIQKIKESSSLEAFDPKQELSIFENLSSDIDLETMAILTKVMEVQVNKSSYPKFSIGEHLLEFNGDLIETINPLMLKIHAPEMFNSLNLKESFDFIKDL